MRRSCPPTHDLPRRRHRREAANRAHARSFVYPSSVATSATNDQARSCSSWGVATHTHTHAEVQPSAGSKILAPRGCGDQGAGNDSGDSVMHRRVVRTSEAKAVEALTLPSLWWRRRICLPAWSAANEHAADGVVRFANASKRCSAASRSVVSHWRRLSKRRT